MCVCGGPPGVPGRASLIGLLKLSCSGVHRRPTSQVKRPGSGGGTGEMRGGGSRGMDNRSWEEVQRAYTQGEK